MRALEQWIWLPEKEYPNCQTTMADRSAENYKRNYRVAELKKEQAYGKQISRVQVRFSGDTMATLYCNAIFSGRAPASAGGDFLIPQLPQPRQYATVLELTADKYPAFAQGQLYFHAVVRLSEARLFEFSNGHGGFFLTAHVFFADGSKTVLLTDESWQIRYLPAYREIGEFDNTDACTPWVPAQRIQNIWHCEDAPIPPCTETYLALTDITLAPLEHRTAAVPMDMIYAGYPVLKVQAKGTVNICLHCREWQEEGSRINCRFVQSGEYACKELHSAGELLLDMTNESPEQAQIEVGFITSCYPVEYQAKTTTSDPQLNDVLATCAHTLRYCRQTLHLDSPRHCELLACTGDYYIESLMTAFSFGDQRLSAFDIRRTAELLRYRDGEMFHVTYSLIWVQMLWDIYCLTGEKELLCDCEDALELLLRRFQSYIGNTGLLETPPSFMFVDWLNPDGISMHHPPKALGQTCMNLFYYGALQTAVKIYHTLHIPTDALEQKMQALHNAIFTHLFDKERKLFFEGLNTPTPEHLLNHDMPQNVEKRYYLKHSDILAAYFGFFDLDTCRDLLRRVIPDEGLGVVQPYFCHFLLEAVYRTGLRDEFTLSILEQWKAPVAECPKGLAEGFYKPEPTYSFDHSHAWGGTPMWSLPQALSGMEILTPGMKKIKLSPSLLGLEWAEVQIPTPYGMVTLHLKQGEKPIVTAPSDVEIILN